MCTLQTPFYRQTVNVIWSGLWAGIMVPCVVLVISALAKHPSEAFLKHNTEVCSLCVCDVTSLTACQRCRIGAGDMDCRRPRTASALIRTYPNTCISLTPTLLFHTPASAHLLTSSPFPRRCCTRCSR